MAKFVFGMNLSLDGYVDHEEFAPDAVLFHHWIEQVGGIAGCLYGRREVEFVRGPSGLVVVPVAHELVDAAAWRSRPKWVVSRSLTSVGPNATLVSEDIEATIRQLKAEIDGEIDIAGPDLAGRLTELGLIDEYRLYYHPVVLGRGTPFFAGPRPRLRLVASDRIGADVMRLTYVPG